jgi:sn-glycerol 3-phosphate transport system substrate-binding protein
VTKSGFDYMKGQGFYDKAPYKGREVAIASLTASEPTEVTRGIRLGNFTQIRAEFGTQMQAIFANKVSVQEGLDTLVKNGDAIPTASSRPIRARPCPDLRLRNGRPSRFDGRLFHI